MNESRLHHISPRRVLTALAARPLLRRLIGNAGWMAADKLTRLAAGLLVVVSIARFLGPVRFGLFSFAQAIVLVFSAFAVMGLPDILVRDLVREPGREREIVASGLILRLVGGSAAFALSAGAIAIMRPMDGTVLLVTVVLASVVFPQALDVIDYRFQALTQVRAIIVLRNVGFLVFAALKMTAVFLHASLFVFAALTALEIFMVAGLLYFYDRVRGFRMSLTDASLAECGRLWRECWPLLGRTFAIGVYMRADQIIIGNILGDRAVGIYAAAVRIPDVWSFIPVSVMSSFIPVLAMTYQRSLDAYEAQIRSLMRPLIFASVAVAAVLSLFSGPLTSLLYGGKYAGAGHILAIYAWSLVFGTFGLTASSWLINAGHMRYGLYQSLIGLAASIALNLWSVPRYGVEGAAFSYVFAQFLTGFALNAMFPATRPVFRAQVAVFAPWIKRTGTVAV